MHASKYYNNYYIYTTIIIIIMYVVYSADVDINWANLKFNAHYPLIFNYAPVTMPSDVNTP